MKRLGMIPLFFLAFALAGCTSPAGAAGTPTVTVTARPVAGAPSVEAPKIGDGLTVLDAWDICFAHTSSEVSSDLTSWGRYSPDDVRQVGPSRFIVTITNVEDKNDRVATVTCTVEGRVGAAVIAAYEIAPR